MALSCQACWSCMRACRGSRRRIAFGALRHGKSTLAAAFARQGAGFLCDDGLLLDVEDSAIRAYCGPVPPFGEDSRSSHILPANPRASVD